MWDTELFISSGVSWWIFWGLGCCGDFCKVRCVSSFNFLSSAVLRILGFWRRGNGWGGLMYTGRIGL